MKTFVYLQSFLFAAASAFAAPWHPAEAPLMTKWAADVSPANALPEYPRPHMVRAKWQNLNGLWDYALTDPGATSPPVTFEGRILVPFPFESALSGVGQPSVPNNRLWYHRTFTIPADWQGQRVLLHFGAVNWQCTVAINGHMLGEHKGGYTAFTYDITGFLNPGANELVVSVLNPLNVDVADAQVLGKQRPSSHAIFYTSATGIWQTVWLEPVPPSHFEKLRITPDVDHGAVAINAQVDGGSRVKVEVLDGPAPIAQTEGEANTDLRLPIPNAHLWSPGDPHLYRLKVSLPGPSGGDSVESYFGMRKISVGKDEKGVNRILLNNQFVFQVGVLDQGYWPDGIYTAPTDEALRHDIETARQLGFNLDRKHAKVEPARWYYWADKLGLLVWQDMPQMFGAPAKQGEPLTAAARQQFETEWRAELDEFYNSPSIVVWTVFNEGWGQHDTEQIVALTEQLDPTRLVNNASGWTDKGVGDIKDTHSYPNPWCDPPTGRRASVCGEFGGLGLIIPGHMWAKNGWGYQGLSRGQYGLTRRFQDVFKIAYGLRESRGLSACVYTQLTDVEQESNGVMTYDRALVKPDRQVASEAIRGSFTPLPPDPNPPIVILPDSRKAGIAWRYTVARPSATWMTPDFDDSSWPSGQAPFGQGYPGLHTPWKTGDIWMRREIDLPKDLPPVLLFSILHDEDAEVYINGVLAGQVPGYQGEYIELPMNPKGRQAIRPGRNLLAVHCHQTTGGQAIDAGIIGYKNQ